MSYFKHSNASIQTKFKGLEAECSHQTQFILSHTVFDQLFRASQKIEKNQVLTNFHNQETSKY